MVGLDSASLVEAETRVVNTTLTLDKLRDATPNNVSLSFAGHLRQHLTRLTALVLLEALHFDRLSVRQHVLFLERGDKHLGKHDNLCATRCRLSYHTSSSRQISRFIFHSLDLAQGQFESSTHLFCHRRKNTTSSLTL